MPINRDDPYKYTCTVWFIAEILDIQLHCTATTAFTARNNI